MPDWKFLYEKYVQRKHRPFTEKAVVKTLKQCRGRLFVDVGANLGFYSILLKNHFEEIYAFEPNQAHFLKWKEKPPNVKFFPYALCDRNGSADLYLGTGTGSHDTLLPVFDYNPGNYPSATGPKRYEGGRQVTVEARSYDSFGFPDADLVKIDVEGAEREVLKGMVGSLESKRVRSVMIEVHNLDWTEEIIRLLKNYGFRVKVIDGHPHLFGVIS
ncbi:MAG TPA: FkbM family methyltransferase [Candidatus Angelobacter sp.]|nr:FkbM family methyltransferase [Candidatus Angelobacter sp.]